MSHYTNYAQEATIGTGDKAPSIAASAVKWILSHLLKYHYNCIITLSMGAYVSSTYSTPVKVLTWYNVKIK